MYSPRCRCRRSGAIKGRLSRPNLRSSLLFRYHNRKSKMEKTGKWGSNHGFVTVMKEEYMGTVGRSWSRVPGESKMGHLWDRCRGGTTRLPKPLGTRITGREWPLQLDTVPGPCTDVVESRWFVPRHKWKGRLVRGRVPNWLQKSSIFGYQNQVPFEIHLSFQE